MGSVKWIACSSCHPDGLTDARVWQNPEGEPPHAEPVRLAHTHPLHWSADRDEVQDFEYTIRGKLMRGRGLFAGDLKPRPTFQPASELDMDLSGKSADLDAMAVYTNSLRAAAVAARRRAGEAVRRRPNAGGSMFHSQQRRSARRATAGPYFSDSTFEAPVQPARRGDRRRARGRRWGRSTTRRRCWRLYRTGPYLHDGRAKTLRDVLTTHNAGDKHGRTSQLRAAEVDELVAFLKSLPFEPPPPDTPNAVKYRPRKRP